MNFGVYGTKCLKLGKRILFSEYYVYTECYVGSSHKLSIEARKLVICPQST